MAVKLIVNGYFRSGTSIIWKILKESNPEQVVFYEPCHESLIELVDKYKESENKINKLHGMDIWKEYVEYYEFFQELKLYHPNINQPVPISYPNVKEYVYKFDRFSQDCILQTNRWHLFLGELKSDFNIPIIHIIRSPIDVYSSIITKYYESNEFISPWKRFIKNNLKIIFDKRAFNIESWYKEIIILYPKITSRYNYVMLTTFEKFFITWILTNYFALKNIDNILIYEQLLKQPLIYKKMVNNLGFKFDFNSFLREENMIIIKDKYYNDKLIMISRKLKIIDEYLFIINKLNLNDERII